ncbi:hypothetical protein YB2330_001606 [Saitoella coloradoensis]
MAIKTKLTEATGIRIPVVQGGMMWVGRAELASAVSNAGGLGILTALTQPTPEDLRKEIRRCRTMTDKPFGVNLTLLPALIPPDYPAYCKVIIEEGIKIVETAGNNPGPVIKTLKEAGIFIIHKCTAIRHALSAQKLGVDMLSIDGFECAGHPGEDDVTGLILLAIAARKLKVPYIASGGFGDGRGLAAALALGAQGINMGSRFMATVEAPIHPNIKQSIVKADERSTALLLRSYRNTTRMYKNEVAKEVVSRENQGVKFEGVRELVAGARGKRVYEEGDDNAGVWTMGQVAGLIDDVPTCQVLLERIEKDAEEIIAGNAKMLVGSGGKAKL